MEFGFNHLHSSYEREGIKKEVLLNKTIKYIKKIELKL
jgi:hypothetical protein